MAMVYILGSKSSKFLQSSYKVPAKFLQSSCKVPVRLANHIKAFEWVAFTVSAGVCGSWWWCGVEVHQVGLLRLFLKLDVFGHDESCIS